MSENPSLKIENAGSAFPIFWIIIEKAASLHCFFGIAKIENAGSAFPILNLAKNWKGRLCLCIAYLWLTEIENAGSAFSVSWTLKVENTGSFFV